MKKILVISLLLCVAGAFKGLSGTKTVVIINHNASNPEQVSKPQDKRKDEGSNTDSNPCNLKDVFCSDREQMLVTNNPANETNQNTVGSKEAVNNTANKGDFSMYTPSVNETDSNPFITADGTDLRTASGCVLANNFYKFGTKIFIHELRTVCTVHDRMNKRYGQTTFDLFTQNGRQYAINFGRKQLSYEVIE